MAKLNKENFKSIMLGILVILSIYLYYKVYFQNPISEYIKSFEQRFVQQNEADIKRNMEVILVKPDRLFLNISKRVSIAVLSNQKEYEKILENFVRALRQGILNKNYRLKETNITFDHFKEGLTFMLEYSYYVNFNDFIYELFKKRIYMGENNFTFDKIFIKEDKDTEISFYNSHFNVSLTLILSSAGFKNIASNIMDRGKLIYSWSDSLGFSQLVEKNTLIPVELSNIDFSQIKQRDDEQKKETIIRKIFPDTILTRKNILKDGSLVITDERRWLLIRPDDEYIFRFTSNAFADEIESLEQAILFYLRTFYSNEDIRILKVENQGQLKRLYLINRIDGIDVLPEKLDCYAIIEVNKNRLKEIRGYLSDVITIRNAKLKVDGMTAIDTIKERKGDIFIKNINLKYILKNGASSYPYWEIGTDSGTVYVETIK